MESVKRTPRLTTMGGSEHSQFARRKLSDLLCDLRVRSGLSGRRAARLAGFGQSKLSKIEGGLLLPSFDDARALCAAYDASAEEADEVLDVLARLHGEVDSARVILRRGAYRKQQQIATIEAETRLQRSFDLGAVIGLLQTPDYMRKVFARRLTTPEKDEAIAARVARQDILRDQTKRFVCIMTEGACRWRAGSPDVMAAQMDHIAQLSRQPNVDIGLIPWTREAHVFPGHEFHIYGDRLVIVAIETATATIQDPRDIAAYAELFTELEALADFGEQARFHLASIAADYRELAE